MDSSEVKVLGGCYKKGRIYKLRVATIKPELMAEWEELSGQPIFNGFLRKTWRGRLVVGHIRSGWRIGEDRSVHPAFPCLEVCLFAGVLAKEVFGIKIEEIQVPSNPCQSCCQLCKGKMSKERGN